MCCGATRSVSKPPPNTKKSCCAAASRRSSMHRGIRPFDGLPIMRLFGLFLTIFSVLLFLASNPELHGPILFVLFFVLLGSMHYLLWGRAMVRAVEREASVPADGVTDPFPAPANPDPY